MSPQAAPSRQPESPAMRIVPTRKTQNSRPGTHVGHAGTTMGTNRLKKKCWMPIPIKPMEKKALPVPITRPFKTKFKLIRAAPISPATIF